MGIEQKISGQTGKDKEERHDKGRKYYIEERGRQEVVGGESMCFVRKDTKGSPMTPNDE